jgi:hypothetical protein
MAIDWRKVVYQLERRADYMRDEAVKAKEQGLDTASSQMTVISLILHSIGASLQSGLDDGPV